MTAPDLAYVSLRLWAHRHGYAVTPSPVPRGYVFAPLNAASPGDVSFAPSVAGVRRCIRRRVARAHRLCPAPDPPTTHEAHP